MLTAAKQKAVLYSHITLYVMTGDMYQKIKMQGLDATKKYEVKEINVEDGKEASFKQSGKTL